MEHAVDAVPDPDVALRGLDVDVGRAVRDGLGDEEVDHLDDGPLFHRRQRPLLAEDVVFGLLGLRRLGGHLLDGALHAGVLADGRVDVAHRGHDRRDVQTGDGPDVVHEEADVRLARGLEVLLDTEVHTHVPTLEPRAAPPREVRRLRDFGHSGPCRKIARAHELRFEMRSEN